MSAVSENRNLAGHLTSGVLLAPSLALAWLISAGEVDDRSVQPGQERGCHLCSRLGLPGVQSMLLRWSAGMVPLTGPPSGRATSEGYHLAVRVLGQYGQARSPVVGTVGEHEFRASAGLLVSGVWVEAEPHEVSPLGDVQFRSPDLLALGWAQVPFLVAVLGCDP